MQIMFEIMILAGTYNVRLVSDSIESSPQIHVTILEDK